MKPMRRGRNFHFLSWCVGVQGSWGTFCGCGCRNFLPKPLLSCGFCVKSCNGAWVSANDSPCGSLEAAEQEYSCLWSYAASCAPAQHLSSSNYKPSVCSLIEQPLSLLIILSLHLWPGHTSYSSEWWPPSRLPVPGMTGRNLLMPLACDLWRVSSQAIAKCYKPACAAFAAGLANIEAHALWSILWNVQVHVCVLCTSLAYCQAKVIWGRLC